METERGAYPGITTAPNADAPGKTGLERAGAYIKDALDKARQKMDGYRQGGIEQVSQDVLASARSRPKTAFLIAAGVALLGRMLLTRGRR